MDDFNNFENIEQPVQRKKEKFFDLKTFMIIILTALISISCSLIVVNLTNGNNGSGKVVIYESVENDKQVVIQQTDFTTLASNVKNCVVEVYTEAVSYSAYFGNYVTEGAGSGVILTKDGYIVTNNHVIEGASSIKVTLNDGNKYDAELIATDSYTDIAVIKIEADNLQAAVLGNSDSLLVGQNCMAVGNPLGTLGGTVTTGIISALSREVTVEDIPMTLLQIDAAISPGNSGGGLFNTNGQLIGIVNAKSTSSYSEGIGFAIPVNIVKSVATDLIQYGYVTGRPVLGIKGVSIENFQAAMSYKVSSFGVYVKEITLESTKNAGLMEGDVITAIDETTISNFADLQVELYKHVSGDEIVLTVARGSKTVLITITLQANY